MKKWQFFVVLGVFIVASAVLLPIALNKKKEQPEPIKYSDEYLYYAERFVFELSSDESYYIITKLKADFAKEEKIQLPNSIDGIPVKKWIGDAGNFNSFKYIHVIEIPENIEYIGTSKEEASILEGGTLGDSFISVSGNELVTINVDSNNKVYSSLDGVLFDKEKKVLIRYPNCKVADAANLKYTIPDSVEEVYEKAFYLNKMLNTLTLGENVIKIGAHAFDGCESLRVVTFNNKLEIIDGEAFHSCDLQSITLPDSLVSIGSRAFSYNEELGDCFIPSSVTYFGRNIFTPHTNPEDAFIIYTTADNVDVLKNNENLKSYMDKIQVK